MLLPMVAYFIIFYYIPMPGVYMAFTKYTFQGGIFGSPFVGLENFKFLAGNLLQMTKTTILYNLVFIGLGTALEISMAVMFSEMCCKWFKKTAQSVLFLPYFISYVLLGAFIYNIFNYEYGAMNSLIVSLGGERYDVYSDVSVWKYIITFFYLWKNVGVGMVIYLASITAIDEGLYEAARIDGASAWQEIRYITLPCLRPTVITMLMLRLSNILKGQFDLFYQIVGDNGLLYKATDILDTYVFRSVTKTFNVGFGTAAGLYQSLFGFALVLLVNWIIRRVDSDYALF
ncbi:MAG: ABC transporter permease subunit [Eubacteriales bacterium]|nr:ABC transporter permease subunit [Eubacteriales bacterium]